MFQQLTKRSSPATQIADSGSRRRQLRPHPEPFPRLDVSAEGCRFSLASRDEAARMTIVIGPSSDAQERYLNALAYAELCHLVSLRKRRFAILMAPSIALGLDSVPAAQRRGRTLTTAEREENQLLYGPDSGVIAIYDPQINAQVVPTARAVEDPEHAVLHELGHGLTFERVGELDSASLLCNLPPGIAAHIAQAGYSESRFSQMAEVMAEAYAYMVVGRINELPPALVSALHAILPMDVELFTDPL
jgi:hypothetical protein